MRFNVEPFDASTAGQEELSAHLELATSALAVDRPLDPAPSYDSVIGAMTTAFTGRGAPQVWVAHDGPEIVGKGIVSHPSETENTHLALIDMQVHPRSRRQGVGTALLRAMLPAVTAHGRTTVASWNVLEGTPAAAWARRLGFRVTARWVVQAVDFATVDRSLWDVPAPHGYHAEHWRNTAPDELVESYARARTAIEDAPTADWSYRPPAWTVERVREAETALRERQVEQRVVAAVEDVTGSVVGMTELEFYSHRPEVGFQHDTAVSAEYRGRGLGAFLKAELLRQVAIDRPATQRVHTSTAGDNETALRMNCRVGFETIRSAIVVEMASSDFVSRLQESVS